MELSRRDLAIAGMLALGVASLIPPALADSEDDIKKAVAEMRAAYLDKDKAKIDSMTLPQLTPTTRAAASRIRLSISRG